jgi:hypothetical protein
MIMIAISLSFRIDLYIYYDQTEARPIVPVLAIQPAPAMHILWCVAEIQMVALRKYFGVLLEVEGRL